MKKLAMALLLTGVLLAGCGGSDDEDSPTAPTEAEVAGLSRVMVAAMREAFVASLISDTTSVPGTRGSVEIAGGNWNFVGYSPDGKLTIDGMLVVDEAKYPEIPIKGTLQLKGSQEGTLVVDMLVKVQGLEITSTGTFVLNGETYDVAELIAAGASSG
ncbi:MAG: hypothetical protein HYW07_22760 [Candidatus Latescibacteria bacterium]|nr:hypothetical protein [Candidatus Latescibacterota bacterium]